MRSGSAGVAASPTLSFSLLRHGRSQITRFISPLSPASSHDSGGTDRSSLQPAPPLPAPPRPTVPADPRVRSAPPWLCRGVGPSRGGDNQWAAESKGSWAGTLGFPSPTFLSLPTGMCSSFSRRLAPRGSTTWGPKNYKSLHPPRRKRERRGAGRSGAQRLEMGSNKGNGGERLCLPDAGHFAHYTPSLPNLCSNPARHCCIQFRERSTCQRSRSAPVVMRLNPEP